MKLWPASSTVDSPTKLLPTIGCELFASKMQRGKKTFIGPTRNTGDSYGRTHVSSGWPRKLEGTYGLEFGMVDQKRAEKIRSEKFERMRFEMPRWVISEPILIVKRSWTCHEMFTGWFFWDQPGPNLRGFADSMYFCLLRTCGISDKTLRPTAGGCGRRYNFSCSSKIS